MRWCRYQYLVLMLLCLLCGVSYAQESGDVRQQRKELEKIQQDVSKSRARLDSLRREEARVEKSISEYDQRIESQAETIGRLRKNLDELKKDVGEAEQQLDSRQSALDENRGRFLASVRRFYSTTPRFATNLVGVPAEEMETKRRMIYLTALVNFESGTVAEALRYFEQSVSELNRLSSQQGQVSKQVRRRSSSYTTELARKDRQEKALDRVRNLKRQEADRIAMLQQSAREMEALIARLETKQKQEEETKPETPFEPGVEFAALQGKLAAPFKGEIVVAYGNSVDPVSRLKSFSPGITVQGRPGGAVSAVGYGKVVYTGYLRGYGNFVIINHDNQYYTTYAGLKAIRVATDQLVDPGATVGTAGDDGLVKFELRKGRQSLDPLDWIRVETF